VNVKRPMVRLISTDTSGIVPSPVASNPMLPLLGGLRTLGGVSLTGVFPKLTLTLRDDIEAPAGLVDFFKVGLLNVVSSKLRDVFESVDGEFEYFPVTVLHNRVQTVVPYFVANPLNRFDAIDLGRSDVDLDEELGDALAVRKLVLDETRFEGHRFAVIAEIQRIGVTHNAAVAISASGCTGIALVDPSAVQY
jgi:hypothetical protein